MISRESRIPRRGREQTMANEGGEASGEIDDDGHMVGGALAALPILR